MSDNRPASSGPPHNPDAESALLGALLSGGSVALQDIASLIEPDDFYVEAHRVVFRGLTRLEKERLPFELVLLAESLRGSRELDAIGGTEFLANLARANVLPIHAREYAMVVRRLAQQRALLALNREYVARASEPVEDVQDLVNEFASKAQKLALEDRNREALRLVDAFAPVFTRLEERTTTRQYGISGVPTGFGVMDAVLDGWQKSDLVVLAARPGMGKTAFALNLLLNAATDRRNPTPGLIFSLEMGSEQLATRVVAMHARVPLELFRKAQLNTQQWARLQDTVSRFGDLPIFVDDSAAISLQGVFSRARQLKQDHGIGVVVVDYLQLMTASADMKRANREQQIAEISRGLKMMAKELQIPVIALSQLSRAAEQRAGNRPALSDLRESGAIEQDADIIIFLYRDGYYRKLAGDKGKQEGPPPSPEDENVTEVIIAKHRAGATDVVKVRWVPEFTLFTNLGPADGPPPISEQDAPPRFARPPMDDDLDYPPPGPAPDDDGDEFLPAPLGDDDDSPY